MAGVGSEPRDLPSFIRDVRKRITALERRLVRDQSSTPVDPTPAGVILPFGGTTAPDGWLLCDGSVISRAANPALFAVFGTTYNTGGEAGTDFRLPDPKGRTLVGKSSELEFLNIGQKGGQKRVTLSVDEMPSHTHPPLAGSLSFWGQAPSMLPGASGLVQGPFIPASGSNTTGSRGGGQSHDNLQPYMVVNYIVKAG